MLEDPAQTVHRMLDAGEKAADIGVKLAGQGMDSESAAKLIEEVLAARVKRSAAANPSQSCNWLVVIASLLFVGLAFVGIYDCIAADPEGIVLDAGGWGTAHRRSVIGGLAGAAVGALNIVRVQLMRLME